MSLCFSVICSGNGYGSDADTTYIELFDDGFIDHLFDLVEQTRDHPDEALNYAVIKFIVSRVYTYASVVFFRYVNNECMGYVFITGSGEMLRYLSCVCQ